MPEPSLVWSAALAVLVLACGAPAYSLGSWQAPAKPAFPAEPGTAATPPAGDRGALVRGLGRGHRPPSCNDPSSPCSEVAIDDPESSDLAALAAEPHPTSYQGSLASAAAADTLQKEAARFRACGLRGTAVVRVIVNGDGRVQSAGFYREHLTEGSKDCLLGTVSSLTFPAPRETAEVLIPFVFRAKTP